MTITDDPLITDATLNPAEELTAYGEGRKAGRKNKPVSNPYRPDIPLHRDWEDGFNDETNWRFVETEDA